MINITDMKYDDEINVGFLLLVWIPNWVTIFGAFMIMGYLKSKPPLSKTIMDFVNMVCFASYIPTSLTLSTGATIALVFEDCGHVLASGLAIVMPTTSVNLQIQLTSNFIVQSLIILYPSFLEDPGFENGVKFLVTMIVPMFSVTLYVLLYLRGIMIGTYYMLRGTLDTEFRVLTLLRFSFNMLTFVVCAVSRCWIMKIRNESGVQENSVMSLKMNLVMMAQCICPLLLAASYRLIKDVIKISPMLPLAFHFCVVMMVCFHPSVINYISNLYPFNLLTQCCSVRSVRRVDARVPRESCINKKGFSEQPA